MPNRVAYVNSLSQIADRSTPEPNSGCWLWDGSVATTTGYPILKHNRLTGYAHRRVWEIVHGAIPSGMYICHACDVPCCVNPRHLFLGTPKDNSQDMLRKGRASWMVKPGRLMRGENVNTAKLTASDVVRIRRLGKDGMSHREIAALFGVCRSNVSHAIQGRNWKHVPFA
jgi:hypothetical protein